MSRLREKKEPLDLSVNSSSPGSKGLLKTGFCSLIVHAVLILFAVSNLISPYHQGGRAVYRVTLRPFSPPGDGNPPGRGNGFPEGPPKTPEIPRPPVPAEKPKVPQTDEGSKDRLKKKSRKQDEKSPRSKKTRFEESREPVEGLKKTDRKGERTKEKSDEKSDKNSVQEALDEIRRKFAVDEIQRRVARRNGENLSSFKGTPGTGAAGAGSATGTGAGSLRGATAGTGQGSGGSPWGTSLYESRLNDYYSLIWAKIKREWTLHEDLPKGKIDLEAVIVIVVEKGGKVQKSWFEKKSGNSLYDQMAMRAIKKAEPFPPARDGQRRNGPAANDRPGRRTRFDSWAERPS